MADNARGIHVSPGIYTREYELTYAVRSLGITSLGLVGETLKGPAFEPMAISNWREFQSMFGGTSTEKYKGSQYPKYELPYIARTYLSESQQLQVVRVLGLSGYNAGPAWVVTASNGGDEKQAVAVLRARGTYNPYKAAVSSTTCVCETSRYDTLSYNVGEKISTGDTSGCVKLGYNVNALALKPYVPLSSYGDECNGYQMSAGTSDKGSVSVSQTNKGRFKIIGVTCPTDPNFDIDIYDSYSAFTQDETYSGYAESYFEYAVSLNPYDKEYILNVLGTTPSDGTAPIYVESLYDVALEQGIADGDITQLDYTLQKYNAYYTADYCHHEPIYGIMTMPMSSLNRRYVGQRLLADKNAVGAMIRCVPYRYDTGMPCMYSDFEPSEEEAQSGATNPCVNTVPTNLNDDALAKWKKTTPAELTVECGQIYTVRQYTTQSGQRKYFYTYYIPESVENAFDENSANIDKTNYYGNLLGGGTQGNKTDASTLVLNNADGLYYRMNSDKTDVTYVELDMNDYRSAYRYASTPWIVSNLKGDIKNVAMTKLFRFHTISDGDSANKEIKISIENIEPDDGTFDVVVRRIDDVDESTVVLERFGKCTMTVGDSNYIAYQIGSFDGVYEAKSNYITVEVNDDTAAQTSVPAGFLGYPIPKYDGTPIKEDAKQKVNFPAIKYNTTYDETVKARKQYFGLSSWVGVDVDTFTFKGTKAYIDNPMFLSRGFHLDSRLDSENGGIPQSAITVDGESGYTFDCVSTQSRTMSLDQPPIIGTDDEMYGSIYEDKALRKFTVFFYGGFDGWDEYRSQRTNTDDYTLSQYKGYIGQSSGEGYSFNKITDPELLGLTENGITSDYYAYLSGIRQFANPEAVDINVFATPGIDYVNQTSLVEEAIEMIETERADSIYVVTTPDKPNGAGDTVSDMYTPEDAVDNLLDTEIDSNYTCTYYPWVKYLDTDNNQYIFLPPTKDVVRNFAQTDNTSYPWFAPAGIGRGNVDCVSARYITKLTDEDTLYENRINPIKTFAQDGPKVWGQKNLQVNEGQLNRIAVRRLLLRMRKLISIACIGLIFEPNDSTTKQSFLSTVTPIMDNIKSNRGISDYRIEVNDSVESRQRRELPCVLYFKPYTALEWITIDFVVTPESVNFDDI